MWKITNIANPAQNIKIAVAKDNATTVGVILQPGQFCITDSRMTSSLDAQSRRNFILIEKEYLNELNLSLCDAHSYSDVEEARRQAEEYKG